MSRTKKKSYTGAKKFFLSCRNHGTCPYCQGGRQYKAKKRCPSLLEEIASEAGIERDRVGAGPFGIDERNEE